MFSRVHVHYAYQCMKFQRREHHVIQLVVRGIGNFKQVSTKAH